MKRHVFRAGEKIPATGVYLAKHRGHKLSEEVALFEDERFPRCPRCEQITFKLLRTVPHIFSDPDFCHAGEEPSGKREDKLTRKIG